MKAEQVPKGLRKLDYSISLNECNSNLKVPFCNFKYNCGMAWVWKQNLMGTVEKKHVLRKHVSNKNATQ